MWSGGFGHRAEAEGSGQRAEGAGLYRAFHRLERRGLIASEWGLSENNRKTKYYQLSSAGRQHLRTEVSEIRRYVAALLKVLEPVG